MHGTSNVWLLGYVIAHYSAIFQLCLNPIVYVMQVARLNYATISADWLVGTTTGQI